MADINFGLLDPNSAGTGVKNANALLTHFARMQAGKQAASGNYDAAQSTLNSYGDFEGAKTIDDNHWSRQEHIQKLTDEQRKQSSQFAADVSAGLYKHMQDHLNDPDGGKAAVLNGFDQLTPLFKVRGASDEQIAGIRASLDKDPATFLTYMHNEAISHMKQEVVGKDAVLSQGPDVMVDNRRPETKTVKDAAGREHVIQVAPPAMGTATGAPQATPGASVAAAPATGVGGAPPAQGAAPASAPAAQPTFEDLYGAVRTQESSNTPGVVNPETGAAGSMQVMPATGQATAQKLGIAWRPDLMTGKTPEAAAYQDKIGRAYLQEAYDANNGDPRATLAYYYGGPDLNRHGPKTRQYVSDVMGRMQPRQVAGPASAAFSAPGVTEVYAPPAEQVWQTKTAQAGDPHFRPGTTYEVNTATGQTRKLQDPASTNSGKGANGQAKLAQSEQAQLRDFRKQAAEMSQAASELDRFVQLNRDVQTGGTMGMPGAGAVIGAFNPKVAQMRSIVAEITPAMRHGLPGSASDKDVAMFRSATVGLDKPYQANVAIRDAAKAYADRQGDYLAFLETYARANQTLLGSEEIWKKYADSHPLFARDGQDNIRVLKKVPWRQAIPQGDIAGGNSSQVAPAVSRVRRYTPGKGFE